MYWRHQAYALHTTAMHISWWKLRTVVARNNRDHEPQSPYYCLFAPRIYIYIVVLRTLSVRGESHNHRNATGEVATTSPPFYNEPHRSHIPCMKAELGMNSTSWSQHHFVVSENPSSRCTKLRTVAASNSRDHGPQSLYHSLFAPRIYIVVLHAHPVHGESHNQLKRHGRGCNSALCVGEKTLHNTIQFSTTEFWAHSVIEPE